MARPCCSDSPTWTREPGSRSAVSQQPRHARCHACREGPSPPHTWVAATCNCSPPHTSSAPCLPCTKAVLNVSPTATLTRLGVVRDGHHRRVDAGAHALHLAQREHAVGRGLPHVDAQVLGDGRLNALRALQPVDVGVGLRVNREKPCKASRKHSSAGACTRSLWGWGWRRGETRHGCGHVGAGIRAVAWRSAQHLCCPSAA